MKDELVKIIDNLQKLDVNYHGIKKLLNSSKRKIDEELINLLKELESEGKLYLDENGIYRKFPNNFFIGNVQQNKDGKYFVIIDNKYHEIRKENLNGSIYGDRVICKKARKSKTFEVIKVLERTKSDILCVIALDDNYDTYLKPINTNQNIKISINKHLLRKYSPGQKVLVHLTNEKYDDYYDGQIIKSFGALDKIEEIAISNGFMPIISPKLEEEIEKIPRKVEHEDLVGRLDLRHKPIYTIDDESAKDLDDAICVEILQNGNYLLTVSIAHVSNYVKYGSELFNYAFHNGTSAYLLEHVFPMLPKELSNGICSLNEGEDRLTRSVIMEYDQNGTQIDYSIVKSVINSKKKMSYQSVNNILEDNIIPDGYENFVQSLTEANKLAKLIHSHKERLDFDSSEPKFINDDYNEIIGKEITYQQTAQKLIEIFMIEANCTIAKDYYYKKLPFVYRNHNIPDLQRFLNTIKSINRIGLKLDKIKDISDPVIVQQILNKLTVRDDFAFISPFLLRSMEKANYSIDNAGHYGLNEKCYTHFTSPIRRLCDLTVHMLIDYYENTEVNEDIINKLITLLDSIANQASIKEKDEDKAEYEANKYADVMLLKNYEGKTFNVHVTEINQNYIKVKTDFLAEGIINYKELGIGYYYNYKERSLKLLDINKTISLLSTFNAVLISANEDERELYFSFPYAIKKQKALERQRKRALNYLK